MKKISILLAILMLVTSIPFAAFATDEDSYAAKDMFKMDFELSDQEVSEILKEACYVPSGDIQPYYSEIKINYYPLSKSFSTAEELENDFWEQFFIKREYAEHYEMFPEFWKTYEFNNKGEYVAVTFYFSVSYDLINEVDSYGSVEKAIFYAKLYKVLSGVPYSYISVPDGYGFIKEDIIGGYTYGSLFPYDVNYDGKVNARDHHLLHKAMGGYTFRGNAYALDPCKDGVLNAKDALYMKTFLVTGTDLRYSY